MSWHPKCMCLHFLKLKKNICHNSAQSVELFNVLCNCETVTMHVTIWKTFASSAKSFLKAWITDCGSLWKSGTESGPRTPPWGMIPLVNLAVIDLFSVQRLSTTYSPSFLDLTPNLILSFHEPILDTDVRRAYQTGCLPWALDVTWPSIFLYISGSNLNVHQNHS